MGPPEPVQKIRICYESDTLAKAAVQGERQRLGPWINAFVGMSPNLSIA
jgi:hypothetical protein